MKPQKPNNKLSFVALDVTSWDGMWMNRQQIMSRIGKEYPVTYSNGPLFSWHIKKTPSVFRLFDRTTSKDNVSLFFPSCLTTRVPSFSLVDEFNRKNFAKKINLKWEDGKRILYVFHPSFVDYVNDVDYDVLVYHCYDNYSKMHGSDPWLNRQEGEICKLADLVFASSESNVERLSKLTSQPERVHFLPNGVDLSLFSKWTVKEKEYKPENSRYRAGYVGSMNDKFDFNLMFNLAKSMPEVDFTLVGRANNLSKGDSVVFEQIKKLPNVELKGLCPREDVPEILASFDVNLFLYKSGSFADECYPLKLHEAFAIGNPIVSTPIKSITKYPNIVSLPNTESEWVSMIKEELKSDTRERREERIRTAHFNTWDIRVADILCRLNKF